MYVATPFFMQEVDPESTDLEDLPDTSEFYVI